MSQHMLYIEGVEEEEVETILPAIEQAIFLVLQMEKVPLPCEVNVMLTDNEEIRGINKEQRKIDKATDVLSFPMFELVPGKPPGDKKLLDPSTKLLPLGDIVISREQANTQAEEIGHSLLEEISYLTIHSVLHLLGYDHMDEAEEKKQMRDREKEMVAKLREILKEMEILP